MRKPTHLSGAAGAAAAAATGNSSPRNWIASIYLSHSPLFLSFSRTHANSGIFNNCTCCAEKKEEVQADIAQTNSGSRLRSKQSSQSNVRERPSPVRGDDEDDNDNAVKMTRQGCRCNARTYERTDCGSNRNARQRCDGQPLRLRGHATLPCLPRSPRCCLSLRFCCHCHRRLLLLVGEINYVANAKCSALCRQGADCQQERVQRERQRETLQDDTDALCLAFISLIGWHLPCRRRCFVLDCDWSLGTSATPTRTPTPTPTRSRE